MRLRYRERSQRLKSESMRMAYLPSKQKHKYEFLKDSFADLRKATGTLDEENLINPTKDPWSGNQLPRLMFLTTGISHPWEMYGQMVIYLRMNGIDPYKNR